MSLEETNEHQIVYFLKKYEEQYTEKREILKAIQQYRQQFLPRLKTIQQTLVKLEEDIWQYMQDCDHELLQFKQLIFSKGTVSENKRKISTDTIEKVLQKYNMDASHPLYQEMSRALHEMSKVATDKKKIRVKEKKQM